MRRMHTGGFTLVEMLVVIAIIGILASILIPTVIGIIDRGKIAKCANNLRQLWTLQTEYSVTFGKRSNSYPHETGGAFWIKLTQVTPPLVTRRTVSLLDCPMLPSEPAPGTCEYQGPRSDVNAYQADQAVGADLPGAHGKGRGANVIYKMGSVTECPEDDPALIEASEELMR